MNRGHAKKYKVLFVYTSFWNFRKINCLTLFRLGFLRVAQLGWGGGGGGKCPRPITLKLLSYYDNEMKPGGVVKDH